MKKIIAITMGDPNGIGPEIIAKMWANPELHINANLIVIGRQKVMQQALKQNGKENLAIPIDSIQSSLINSTHDGPIPILEVEESGCDSIQPSAETASAGRVAYQAIKRSAELAMAGDIDAIVTAPINKKALNAAGIEEPGHTELLARFCDVENVAMMLYLPPAPDMSKTIASNEIGLSIVHCTLHTSMRSIFDLLTQQLIEEKIRLASNFCNLLLKAKKLKRKPRVSVAALNPHAGEQGMFGDEEKTIIEPAIAASLHSGLDVHGPFPVDTLMRRAAGGEFDAVVAMYHDQGHIAVKLLDMFGAVNITLGLPIIRTSVAHGTAADIAWSGKADARSLIQAVHVAIDLCEYRS